MPSVNKVHIIGNLGKDPELRNTASGSAICNITVATSRAWKDKTSGERQEETEWHRVALFDRQAEVAAQYLKKGRSVYIEGRLKTRKWTDKEGQERYTTEVIANEMVLLGGAEEAQPKAPQRTTPPATPLARQAAKPATSFDDMDDDVPF